MISTKINIARLRLRAFHSKIYLLLLKLRGLKVGKNPAIGKIHCDWPNKIKMGDNCIVREGNYFWFKYPFDDSNCMEIGDNSHIGRYCTFNVNTQLIFGKDNMIGDFSQFADINHQIDPSMPMNIQPITTGKIVFGDDVWIGYGCIVLKDVTIGDGSVVAAGSLINKSIPPYEIWGGIPAKKIGVRA